MTRPNTSRSSGYQSPPAASVTGGSSIAGMQPRRQRASGVACSRSSMATPPQPTKRQSIAESSSVKNGSHLGSMFWKRRHLYSR